MMSDLHTYVLRFRNDHGLEPTGAMLVDATDTQVRSWLGLRDDYPETVISLPRARMHIELPCSRGSIRAGRIIDIEEFR